MSKPGVAGRALLLAYLAWETVRQLRSDEFEFGLFGGVVFGVHELGHLVFAPFGELLSIAGGSIAQLALPIAAMALFHSRRDRFAVVVSACWLAFSIAQMAVYIADARSEVLDLVSFSADGVGHDWNYLLERLYILRHDRRIATLARVAAWLVLVSAIIAGCRELAHARRQALTPDSSVS